MNRATVRPMEAIDEIIVTSATPIAGALGAQWVASAKPTNKPMPMTFAWRDGGEGGRGSAKAREGWRRREMRAAISRELRKRGRMLERREDIRLGAGRWGMVRETTHLAG